MKTVAALMLVLNATAYDETFTKAVGYYQSGDYATAASLFEQLVHEGVDDPRVFYNLGNTYYQLEIFGAAIANYQRAIQLDPNMTDARENMLLAISRTPATRFPPGPRAWEQAVLFWHFGTSLQSIAVAGVLAWTLFWAGLAIRYWRPVPYLLSATGVAGTIALLCAASVFAKLTAPNLAVAAVAAVPVRFSPHDDGETRFALVEGDTVVIEESALEWTRIVTDKDERGWVKRSDLVLVGPPYDTGINARTSPGSDENG